LQNIDYIDYSTLYNYSDIAICNGSSYLIDITCPSGDNLSFECNSSTFKRQYDYSCPYKTFEPRCITAENDVFIIDPNCDVIEFDNYKTICKCSIDNNTLTRRLSDSFNYNNQIGSINQINSFSSSSSFAGKNIILIFIFLLKSLFLFYF
jgi:hypothetical protein